VNCIDTLHIMFVLFFFLVYHLFILFQD